MLSHQLEVVVALLLLHAHHRQVHLALLTGKHLSLRTREQQQKGQAAVKELSCPPLPLTPYRPSACMETVGGEEESVSEHRQEGCSEAMNTNTL